MRCSPGARGRQREQVRGGEVAHVDVVADAGAVRGRVVLAVDRQRVAGAGGHLQGDRDQVRLGGVPLPEPERGARDVEVAQADGGEAVGRRIRAQHRVDGELRGPVGVGRPRGSVLADRHLLRLAVGGRGGGEDDPPAVDGTHRLQQGQGSADVRVPVLLRPLLRLADQALRREVQHRLGPHLGQHRPRLVQRRRHQACSSGHCVGVAGGQVVEHGDLVTLGEQRGRDYAADVTGAAGDEKAHVRTHYGRAPEALAERPGRVPARKGCSVVSARPAVQALPAYRPGRNPADLAREIGVARAVKLASNEVAFPPLPDVLQALATTAVEANRYPDNAAVVLTGALAERYRVAPEQVATGGGGVMLLQELAQAFYDPGTSIVFAWRSFEMYPLIAQVAAPAPSRCRWCPARPGGPADTHDLDGLAAALDENTQLVFVCNPNNPTGTAVRRAELERFLDAVPGGDARRPRRGLPRVRHRPRGPRRPGADARAAQRGRAAHLLQGVGAGGAAGRLPDRRGPGGGRGGAQDPRAVQRLLLAQAAAVAALAGEDEVRRALRRRRRRAGAADRRLRERGLDVPDSQANFVWLPLGERTAQLGRGAGGPRGHHPAVRRRGHPGDGRHARGGRRRSWPRSTPSAPPPRWGLRRPADRSSLPILARRDSVSGESERRIRVRLV